MMPPTALLQPVSARLRRRTLPLLALLASAVLSAAPDDPRVSWGRERLTRALHEAGYLPGGVELVLAVEPDSPRLPATARHPEGFAVRTEPHRVVVTGADAAGVLYGCLAVADRIRHDGDLPAGWQTSDAPRLAQRGPCLLLMKLGDYNFPVTPEEFPFFYDRAQWLDWLDYLAEQRFNTLAIWNGHPFAYFVRFNRFPEAQAGMPPGLVERNRELLHWIVVEAERRNIRLLFEFYNIHTSVYFQRAHDLPAENRTPTPLLRDYTAYALETFAREFPEIGYYITPGEAIEPRYTDEWVNQVLLPALARGGARGPVWLRSWGMDLPRAQRVAAAHPDVWMERKFNVEMIADTRPDPENREWAALTGRFIVNIHMAANLEPFRWCPPEFIRQCVAGSVANGAGGLHLYPRKAWRWPAGSEPALPVTQWQRDHFWYTAWARYSWNPDRDPATERTWWEDKLAGHFGSAAAAAHLLDAQQAAADVLPGLQRLIWLGFDNHTVVASGIRLTQLEHAEGIPFLELTDVARRIPAFLADLRAGRVPVAPTPADFLDRLAADATRAADLAARAARDAQRHQAEAAAWARDAEAVRLIAEFYRRKMTAAVLRARAEAPGTTVAPDAFLQPLEHSLETFRQLATLLTPAYDSVSDVPATQPARLKTVPYHWNDLVPLYERELDLYRRTLQDPGPPPSTAPSRPGFAGLLYGDAGWKRVFAADPLENLAPAWNLSERGRGWSSEWRGLLLWPRNGTVTLRVTSDHVTVLDLGGRRVLDGGGFPGAREVRFSAQQGEAVAVRLAYDHPEGETAALVVEWDVGGGFVPIPAAALRHSDADARWSDTAVFQSEL